MAGYIGSKSSVTLVDGYTEAEADAEFVTKTGDTMSGNLDVTGDVDTSGLFRFGVNNSEIANNYLRFKSGGAAYFDHSTVGQPFNFRVSNSSSLDTNAMTINSSGNVGIIQDLNIGNNDSSNPLSKLRFGATQYGAADIRPSDEGGHKVGLDFYTDGTGDATINPTLAMRINSSGRTSGGATINYRGSSNDGLGSWSLGANGNLVGAVYQDIPIIANRMGNDGYAVSIRRRGTQIGGINISGTTTQYITSSDYRLKENVVDLTGASSRVNQLNPSRFNWIADDTNTAVDGFLAHEVADVVPEAITGTKDAMKDEEYEVTPAVEATYDDDGNELTAAVEAVMGTRSVPDYQGIDQSKLVPLLTAALQEALTEIASLKTRVEALEA